MSNLDRPGMRRTEPEAWVRIRGRIFGRDQGRCHACGTELTWSNYELGHKVDRVAGGSDEDDNLVVMCAACNRMKPVHETPAEFVAWVKAGGAVGEIAQAMKADKEQLPPVVRQLFTGTDDAGMRIELTESVDPVRLQSFRALYSELLANPQDPA